jgi:aminoglycoside phosphotransferase family enzyme
MAERSESERRRQLVAWLEARAPGGTVTIAETRISILAFQGERVYKLKKAVRFPFIDLSTAARRLEDCRRELALNRRIAPTSTSASTP